ncbi:MAG: zinc ABC transporter solute-binding protein, partial [Saprospiraceae bacterium]|nr:zinc ABC transporter solute-binding protein [Saprospiraceae bacterium]
MATTTMIADMTRQIVGDRLAVESLLPVGSDPHVYESTPEDVKRVAAADLILMNGLTLEGWIKELVDNSGTRSKIATVTEGVEAIGSDEHAGSFDPHAWMSAANGLIYIDNILKAVTALDPSGKDFYEKNYTRYKKELEETDLFIKEKIAQIPENQRILITSHDAFHYFGNQYGLRLEAVMGTSTDADVRTSDIIRLIKIIKETGVPAIFVESTINPKLLKQIAKDNDIKIGGSLFADSLSGEADSANTYISMLRRDAELISYGLSQTKAVFSRQNAQNTEGIP